MNGGEHLSGQNQQFPFKYSRTFPEKSGSPFFFKAGECVGWLKTHSLVSPSTTHFAQQTLHFTWSTPTKAPPSFKKKKGRGVKKQKSAKTASSCCTSELNEASSSDKIPHYG